MSTEIYYFSGTGNSLHVARELQKRIPDASLTPVVSLLGEDVIKTEADTVGVVFPIYLTTLPMPVKAFASKLDLGSANYVFAIGTRLGTFCLADIALEKMLKKQGQQLDAYFLLNMANNTPTGLVPGPGDKDWGNKISDEHVRALDATVHERLDVIQEAIINKVSDPEDDSSHLSLLLKPLRSLLLTIIERSSGGKEIPYTVDSTCTGCGTCAEVCPSGKVELAGGKPAWREDVQCYYCYACFNYCPTQSILVGKKYTLKDGRYSHPGVTASDIAGQKGT